MKRNGESHRELIESRSFGWEVTGTSEKSERKGKRVQNIPFKLVLGDTAKKKITINK